VPNCCRAFACLTLLLAASVALAAATEGTIAPGTAWATRYYVREGGQPGPTVLVIGGIHGNEPAGARAASQIRHWPIVRGKLIVVPEADVPSLRDGQRLMPTGDDRDLDRDFPRSADEPPRGDLAAALWRFVSQARPDWLLDLHEGLQPHRQSPKSSGSSIICGSDPAAQAQARRMLETIEESIPGPDPRFILLHGAAEGSLARAAADRLGVRSMILETTFTGQPLSLRVRRHRLMVHRLLADLGMTTCSVDLLFPATRGRDEIRVALYAGEGTGQLTRTVERKLQSMAGVELRRIGPDEILAGALGQFDLLVVPGGSASKQAKAITAEGREAIRRFVAAGGGYLGTCAGAYLATCRYTWSLGILDATVLDTAHWKRGKATVKIELTADGRRLLGGAAGEIEIRYANGPLLAPAQREEIPDFVPLAVYRTEVAENGAPKGVMANTPAIVMGRWGNGRVLVSSPHPEYTPGLEALFLRAVLWAAGRLDG